MIEPRHMTQTELIEEAYRDPTGNPLAYHLALLLEVVPTDEEWEQREITLQAEFDEELTALSVELHRVHQQEITELHRRIDDLERENEILRTYDEPL